ncbi:MAG: hypothetical protein JWR18_2207 [Segetibacter sp.]|nr:hypothetical protein [Segetibacter sp.]
MSNIQAVISRLVDVEGGIVIETENTFMKTKFLKNPIVCQSHCYLSQKVKLPFGWQTCATKTTFHSFENNYFPTLRAAIVIIALFILPSSLFATKRYAIATGNWNATSTWAATSGGSSGASIPASADTVYISEASVNYTVTIPAAYAAACSRISMGNSAQANGATLTFTSATSTLTTNSVTIYSPNANVTRTINVNAGTLTVNNNLTLGEGVSGTSQTRITRIYLTTGTVIVGGDIIMNAIVDHQSEIDLSNGAATLRLGGDLSLVNNAGTLSSGSSSKIVFDGSGTQTLPIIAGAVSYYNIEVSKPSGTLFLSAATSILGTVTLTAGNLSTNGNNLYVSGNWVNNGGSLLYNSSTEAVVFSGAGKTISGTGSTSFPRLTLLFGTSVTIQNTNSCSSLSLSTGFFSTSLTHSTTGNLTVNGDVTISQPFYSATFAWNINAGSATVTGTINLGGSINNSTYISKIAITTGTLTANNIIFNSSTTQPGTAAIDMSGGAGQLNLAGAFTLTNSSGTLTPGTSSTVNYNGTSAQTISFPSAIRFNNIHINNDAGVTPNAAITSSLVSGDIKVQSGIFNYGSYSITGAATKTFEVANGATFNTSISMVSGFGTKTFFPSSTVNYNGSAQTVSSETYGHLILSGSGIKTLPGTAFTIAGDFTTSGTISATTGNNITIGGNATFGLGTSFDANSNTHSVGGNWTNDGATFTPGTSTIIFNGTSGQNITSTTPFNNVTVNKTSGAITSTGDITIKGLTFIKGLIATGSNKVIITATGSVSGAAQTTGWVNGNLQLSFSAISLIGTYAVGSSNYYSPFTLTFSGITSPGAITGRFTETSHPDLSTSDILVSKNIMGYWNVVNSGSVVFSSYTIALSWNSFQTYSGLKSALLKISEYSASTWSLPAVTGVLTATSVQALGITTFGDFIAGETCAIGTWTGATSTAWHVATNWQCATVPDNTINVIIPSSLTNYPVVSLNSSINNLTLDSGSSITISSGSLKINGTITNNGGSLDAAYGTVELTGTATQTIPANLFTSHIVKDLLITNAAGIVLADSLKVTGSVGFGNVNNSVFTTAGFLTLASTASTTASVLDITNNGVNSGNSISGVVTVERYIQGRRSYRFLSSPVNSETSIKANWMENSNNANLYTNSNPVPGFGTHISGAGGIINGFDATATNNPSLFTFNNATQTWVAAPNTSGLLTAGSSYRIMVRGSRSVNLSSNEATSSATTLRSRGTLVTGTLVLAKPGGGGTTGMPALSSTLGGYTLLGNPYASTIDWKKVTVSDIADMFYYYDPAVSGNNGRGAYVTYNGVLDITNNSSSNVNRYIQSGQAVFVQTTGANPTITFSETNKKNRHNLLFRSVNELPHIAVQLMIPKQTAAADGVKVFFSDNFNNAIGPEDSYKFNNLDENIGINRNAATLSLEGRKSVHGADSIPLKIWQLSLKNYSLKVDVQNFAANVEVYLEDKYLNIATPLPNGETIIPLNITSEPASSSVDRFRVVFETSATLPVRLTGVKAYAKNNGVQVDWVAEAESNMDLYEVERSTDAKNFQIIASLKAQNNSNNVTPYGFFDVNPNADNYYRIKSIDKSGDVKLSEVVRVQIASAKNTITVVNNPVRGKTIRLMFDNVAIGNYSVSLTSAAGEKVYDGKINNPGGTSFQQLELNNHLSTGIYQLHITNGATNKTIQVLMQ